MTQRQIDLLRIFLRDWVRAEIVAEIESRVEGEDGHRHSAVDERVEADRLFNELMKLFGEMT